jgi:hypothetical protein
MSDKLDPTKCFRMGTEGEPCWGKIEAILDFGEYPGDMWVAAYGCSGHRDMYDWSEAKYKPAPDIPTAKEAELTAQLELCKKKNDELYNTAQQLQIRNNILHKKLEQEIG